MNQCSIYSLTLDNLPYNQGGTWHMMHDLECIINLVYTRVTVLRFLYLGIGVELGRSRGGGGVVGLEQGV